MKYESRLNAYKSCLHLSDSDLGLITIFAVSNAYVNTKMFKTGATSHLY